MVNIELSNSSFPLFLLDQTPFSWKIPPSSIGRCSSGHLLAWGPGFPFLRKKYIFFVDERGPYTEIIDFWWFEPFF
jgi:hypothetical protein